MEESRVNSKFAARPGVRVTYGEILPDGSVVDLLLAADGEGLDLVHSDGKQNPTIAPQIQCGDIVYRPPTVDANILEAITFPRGVAEYDTERLVLKVAQVCIDNLRVEATVATNLTLGIFIAWTPELAVALPTVCLIGATMRQATNVFRLLKSLCRRPMRVAELSRNLPIFLRPTLLITDPNLRDGACAFWNAAGYRGVYVAGRGGAISQFACPKAVFLRPGSSLSAWGEHAVPIVLPPAGAPDLSETLLASLAAELQPQLQMFRLDWLRGREESVAKSREFSGSSLASRLVACLQGDLTVMQIPTPQLEANERELRPRGSVDSRAASVEAIWIPSHNARTMSIEEITSAVNTLVGSRGETYKYNSREIGRRLSDLGVRTRSTGKQKQLKFTDEIRRRLHELAREFQLELSPVPGCPLCQSPEVIDSKLVK